MVKKIPEAKFENLIAVIKKKRRHFGAKFKTKVVLEALKERESVQQIAEKYELHPNQITTWKKQFLDNADQAFGDDKSAVGLKKCSPVDVNHAKSRRSSPTA